MIKAGGGIEIDGGLLDIPAVASAEMIRPVVGTSDGVSVMRERVLLTAINF
jgi:hypothetical protein